MDGIKRQRLSGFPRSVYSRRSGRRMLSSVRYPRRRRTTAKVSGKRRAYAKRRLNSRCAARSEFSRGMKGVTLKPDPNTAGLWLMTPKKGYVVFQYKTADGRTMTRGYLQKSQRRSVVNMFRSLQTRQVQYYASILSPTGQIIQINDVTQLYPIPQPRMDV